jgi:hypothetical protein
MRENDRLGRIEAMIEIGQLPPRYAFACDSRDFDALVALYDMITSGWPTLSAPIQ